MGRRRIRQLALFVAVLALPGVMIAMQGRRLAVQERELASTRLQEITKRTAAEIGQDIVTRLERLRTQAMANAPSTPVRAPSPSNPAVVAVGWVDGEQLIWPWDMPATPAASAEENPEFDRVFAEGRRAEFAEKRPDRASGLYRQAIQAARRDAERAAANLELARTQRRAGQRSAAIATYRAVLRMASTVTDDHGLSCWSSAAAPLVELGAKRDVLDRVTADLASASVWTPVQMYRFRTILEKLRASGDASVERDAGQALERLAARLVDLEKAESLQKDFPRLPLSATNWHPYKGSDVWLVGRSPEGATAKRRSLASGRETTLYEGAFAPLVRSMDGSRLAFAASDPKTGRRILVTMSAQGGDVSPDLLPSDIRQPPQVVNNAAWMPGGAAARLPGLAESLIRQTRQLRAERRHPQ